MANNPFLEREERYSQLADELRSTSRKYALGRTIVFLLTIGLSVYFANDRMAGTMTITFLGGTSLFAYLIFRHNKLKYRRNNALHLVQINKEELLIQYSTFQELDGGDEAIDDEHAYTSDLDIFGRNSLFQFVNRTVTQTGRTKLVDWMRHPASLIDIKQRQIATHKLSDQLDWRQQFRAAAMHYQRTDSEPFQSWVKENHKPFPPWKLAIAIVFAILNITVLTGLFMWGWSIYLVAAAVGISFLFQRATVQAATRFGEQIGNVLPAIQSTHDLLRSIQMVDVAETYLQNRKDQVFNNTYNVLSEIRKLRLLLQFFEARGNAVYMILHTVLLGDMLLLYVTNNWKGRNNMHVSDWIDCVGEFECIVSLAATNYAHDVVFPEVTNDYNVQLQHVGHPLIPKSERVYNDFSLSGKGSVVIITGSNMSGKSTFLRTLGINFVLAYMGGPVFASSASMGLFRVFTGMRSRDDLESHISSFYAELRRISQLLHILHKEPDSSPVFYVLDEILKGTNSADRHKGSRALIRQLLATSSLGMVSTHDVELGSLASENSQVRNMHFESDIVDNEISFDYKIRPGVCQSFNASLLMEKMGVIPKKS